MFDTTTGRWTTEDPSGFAAGDVNLYRYLGNSPVNGTDPTGLQGNPPVAVGHLTDGQRAGAGTVSFQTGFTFSTYSPTFTPRPDNPTDAWILSTSRALFDKLIDVAKQRRAARLGDDPGKSYSPGFRTGSDTEDPSRVFVTYFWENFLSKAGDLSKQENREKLLNELTERDPNAFNRFGMTPGTANNFAGRALDGTGSSAQPPIPLLTTLPGSTKPVVGSKYLLGHWQDPVGNDIFDFTAQAQNFTQVYHFNTGMGWYRVGKKEPGTEKWFPELAALLGDSSLSVAQRKIKIVKWLAENGHVEAHFLRREWWARTQGQRLLTARERGDVRRIVDEETEKIKKELRTDTPLSRFKVALGYDSLIKNDWNWKEAVDVVQLAKGFKNRRPVVVGYEKYFPPSSLDIYAAYEVASTEGFHLFGIDSINDLIATEAGRLFAQELLSSNIPIRRSADPAAAIVSYGKYFQSVDIDTLLQKQFLEARQRVAALPVFTGRERMQDALFSVMMAANPDGSPAAVVLNGMHHPQLSQAPIWKATLGQIMSQNAARWGVDQLKDKGPAFVEEVASFISDVRNRTASEKVFPSGGRLSGDQIRTLDEIVEVLMFFEDIPSEKKP